MFRRVCSQEVLGNSNIFSSQKLHQFPLVLLPLGLRVPLRPLPFSTPVLLLPGLHVLLIGDGGPPVLLHVAEVLPLQQGKALQLVEGQVVAGDKMEAPGAELVGIVKLRRQKKTCRKKKYGNSKFDTTSSLLVPF